MKRLGFRAAVWAEDDTSVGCNSVGIVRVTVWLRFDSDG
jgi:hypothetical protein